MPAGVLRDLVHGILFGGDLLHEVLVGLRDFRWRAMGRTIRSIEKGIDRQPADVHRIHGHLPDGEQVRRLAQCRTEVRRSCKNIQRIGSRKNIRREGPRQPNQVFPAGQAVQESRNLHKRPKGLLHAALQIKPSGEGLHALQPAYHRLRGCVARKHGPGELFGRAGASVRVARQECGVRSGFLVLHRRDELVFVVGESLQQMQRISEHKNRKAASRGPVAQEFDDLQVRKRLIGERGVQKIVEQNVQRQPTVFG